MRRHTKNKQDGNVVCLLGCNDGVQYTLMVYFKLNILFMLKSNHTDMVTDILKQWLNDTAKSRKQP